jgi:hypothetical protein
MKKWLSVRLDLVDLSWTLAILGVESNVIERRIRD